MATATSRNHLPERLLPPSPPLSPPSAKRRRKKKLDPFEELALTPVPSRPASPANAPGDEQDSLFSKIIFTPVLFTSFILSLFLVNHRNRARRAEAHTSHPSILSYLAPSRWLDPEPYQDPDNSRWGRGGPSGHFEPHDALGPRGNGQSNAGQKKHKKKNSWHLNKKIRKVAKLEVSDAFEMRGRVMAVMVFIGVLSVVAMWMTAKWFMVALSKSSFRFKL